MFTCILLTAGLSRRFGSPKALAILERETVIERLQNLLLTTQIDEIVIVLGAQAECIKPYLLKHNKVKFVYHKDYNLGQTSSFKAGMLGSSKNVDGFLLLPVDYPFIKKQTINALIRFFKKCRPLMVIPSFDGKRGHPPLFSAVLKHELLNIDNTCGINSLIQAHKDGVEILAVEDEGVVRTFNTPEEWKVLTALNRKHHVIPE